MSSASISRYSYQFLDHLEMLHVAHLPAIANMMQKEGGYYMLFDSTCEAGSGSLFNVLGGWRNWILGSWRQSTENTQEMLPHVIYLTDILGAPLAIMKDMSVQGQYVADEIEKRYPNKTIRIFVCHYHFVKDIGKDILHIDHNSLKSLIRDAKANLARLIRDTRDKVTDNSKSVARTMGEWLASSESMAIPMGSDAIAIVRYLSQWVLDSSQDGDSDQFPFELPYLLFYERIIRMSNIAAKLLKSIEPDLHSVTHSLLNRLFNITTTLAKNRKVERIASLLRSKNDLFIRLRRALRLEKKTNIEDDCNTIEKRKEFHQKAKEDFESFVAELRKMLESYKIKSALKKAIGIIITHIDKYNDKLWGHDIPVIDHDGNTTIRIADRTNNACEQSFAKTKNNERRRSGRKNLSWELTVRPAAVSLVENLKDEEYLDLVCNGSLDNLPFLFAKLENDISLDFKEQIDAYKKGNVVVFDSGRLPRADVKVVRSEAFNSKISSLEALCT